jgi:peptidyl-prolyl cis-trans isomerase D
MLDIMRRKQRLKLVLWLVIASLGLGMLLFFIPGTNMGGDAIDSSAATIDGNSISYNDFSNTFRKMRERYTNSGRNLDSEMLKAFGGQLIDTMIQKEILKIIAKRFGVKVTPAEIQRIIKMDPSFQVDGKFNLERYLEILGDNATSYEDMIYESLLKTKVSNILTDYLDVSEREIREEFSRVNQRTQVDYALIKKEDYKKRIKPTEAELRSYFDSHKAAYHVKEKRRTHYLLVPFGQFIARMPVTDQEIDAEWKRKPHDETVEAAHILFKIKEDADDEAVKAKAESVLKSANKAGADFAALAKKYSEDEGSAGKGGNLGPMLRKDLVKEFADVAFSLKPGEISQLVKTEFGYHIIKLLKHEKPTKDRASLAMIIQLRKSKDLAKKKAEEAARQLEKQKDLQVAADRLGAEVKAEIKDTGFIAKNDETAADATILPVMINEIFELKGIDAIGKVAEHALGYAIPKLIEVQMPRPGDFSEFRSQIEKDYAEFKVKELLQADAKKLSEDATKQGSLEKAAKAMGVGIKKSDEFALSGTPSSEIGQNYQFTKAAFDLEPGGVSAPQSIYENMAVFQVKSRTPFDESAYQESKPGLRKELLHKKQGPYFQEYVRKVADDLEKSGKIRINPKAIERALTSY